jgi:hypothetical protein
MPNGGKRFLTTLKRAVTTAKQTTPNSPHRKMAHIKVALAVLLSTTTGVGPTGASTATTLTTISNPPLSGAEAAPGGTSTRHIAMLYAAHRREPSP